MQRFPKPQWIVMEKDAFILLLLHCLLLAVWGNSCLISALSAKEHTNLYNESQSSQAVNKNKLCNETAILEVMQICGKSFEEQINQIHPKYWCNFTHIVSHYSRFSFCTEMGTENQNCYWPNPQVENYIISVHKMFFSNCTLETVILQDPPEGTLIILIAVPVFLTTVMIALVVWCSKRNDILV